MVCSSTLLPPLQRVSDKSKMILLFCQNIMRLKSSLIYQTESAIQIERPGTLKYEFQSFSTSLHRYRFGAKCLMFDLPPRWAHRLLPLLYNRTGNIAAAAVVVVARPGVKQCGARCGTIDSQQTTISQRETTVHMLVEPNTKPKAHVRADDAHPVLFAERCLLCSPEILS